MSVAICEHLLSFPTTFAILVTHFPELRDLLSPYPNVAGLVCAVAESGETYTFAYHVVDGQCEVRHLLPFAWVGCSHPLLLTLG